MPLEVATEGDVIALLKVGIVHYIWAVLVESDSRIHHREPLLRETCAIIGRHTNPLPPLRSHAYRVRSCEVEEI